MKTTTIVSLLLLALTARGQDDQDDDDQYEDEEQEGGPVGKASSRNVNCICQCSNYTVLDKHGRVKGNCRSIDSTGAAWCFVDRRYSKCSDLIYSSVWNRSWSRQACATASLSSRQCRGR
jgi:hypothetical protein